MTMHTCPTCGALRPDLAAEKAHNDALGRHKTLLGEVDHLIGDEAYRRLSDAAADIYIATESAI